MNGKTIDEIWLKIKDLGEQENKTIEVSKTLSELINRISRERINEGLSQRDMAEKTGIKQANIARIEKLQIIPRVDTLIKLAKALDMEICILEKSNLNQIKINSSAIYNSCVLDFAKPYYKQATGSLGVQVNQVYMS